MTTYTVTNLNDSGAGSLRQAIIDAGASAGTDSIVFATGLSGGTITLTSGELEVRSDVTIDGDIDGDGSADITVSGNDASRVFTIGATVTLNGLVIRDGAA